MPAQNNTPKEISDAMLLAWIEIGLLVIVDPHLEHPRLFFRGNEIAAELNMQGGRRRILGSERYRWKIRFNGKCRRIMRSRLVWMFCKRELIPEDCRIHHGEKGRLDDSIGNLEKMTDEEHQEHHYPDHVPF